MPIYDNSDQFYATAQLLFDRVQKENPQAVDDIRKAKLLIQFMCTEPEASITIKVC